MNEVMTLEEIMSWEPMYIRKIIDYQSRDKNLEL